MSGLPQATAAALAPLRDWFTRQAQEEAERIRCDARADADAMLDEARATGRALLERAAAEGEAAARGAAELVSARARRTAHERVLAAQESVRTDVLVAVRDAATALREDPRYPELITRLRERARDVLGDGATVTESDLGGLVAVCGSRRLDLTLPVLATQALEGREEEVRRLWTA